MLTNNHKGNSMEAPVRNVLFLCTGNAGRSIIAEAILNRFGEGKFRAFSAGSQPRAAVNPTAMRLLRSLGYDVEGLRPKSWDEFARPEAPKLDVVITVCDSVANEPCPVWPGGPAREHWSIPDPTAGANADSGIDAAFAATYCLLYEKISGLCARRTDSLSVGG
jgi:arsenate reductase (thioredoxin)